jgi:hypothetical protein
MPWGLATNVYCRFDGEDILLATGTSVLRLSASTARLLRSLLDSESQDYFGGGAALEHLIAERILVEGVTTSLQERLVGHVCARSDATGDAIPVAGPR